MIGGTDSNNHLGYEGFSLFQPEPPMSSPSSIFTNCMKRREAYLPEGYIPGPFDVICQRGKDCHEHVGNRRFRAVVERFLHSYITSKTRQEKSVVISDIVKMINETDGKRKGGFIMKDAKTTRWHHVDSKVARDKVGNALREASKLRDDRSASTMEHNNSGQQTAPTVSRVENSPSGTKQYYNEMVFSSQSTLTGEEEKAVHSHGFKRDESYLADRTLSSHEQYQQGGSYYSHVPRTIDSSCFSISPSDLVGSGVAFSSFEALAQSMDIDDLADLEPRPIENMLRRRS